MDDENLLAAYDDNSRSKNGNHHASMLIVAFSFSMIIIGVFLSGMANLTQPPDSADYSSEGYAEVYEDYQDRMFTLEGMSVLLQTTGVVVLGAGLLFTALFASDRLPQWVRVAFMAGAMLFLVRLLTSDLSLTDAILLSELF